MATRPKPHRQGPATRGLCERKVAHADTTRAHTRGPQAWPTRHSLARDETEPAHEGD
jgi:hypothetical protein